MTSHPSQDVATPLALDQPAFDLPDVREEEAGPGGAAEADGKSSSRGEDKHDGSSEKVLQYTGHQLPRNKPMGTQQDETRDEERVESGDWPDPESQPASEHTQNHSASEQEPQHTQNRTKTASDTETPTEAVSAEDEAQEEHVVLDNSGSLFPPPPSSPVLSALNRAKKNQLSRTWQQVNPQSGDTPQIPGRGRGRGRIPLQRSSSLPSSLLSPSRVVSSVRIQFGRGQASCTQPRYSIKYTQEAGGDKEEKEDGQSNCLSTLIINPAPSSDSNNQPPRLPTEAPIPPKPIPRYLMRSSCSLQSSSPPPDWSPGSHSWSTQSVPDLSSNKQQPGQFQQNMSANQNQQSWNAGQTMFPYPSPTAQYLNPSPNPSPSLNPSPYPFTLNPPPQYPTPLHPYGSLPNLLHHHNPAFPHHSSLTSLHQPTTSTIPQHGSLSNLHQPSTSTAPHHGSLGNLYPGTPAMHHQGYSHHSPYHATPHGSQFVSPYLGYHGYNMNPHLPFPHPVTQCPPLPEHFHPGLAPPAPGFLQGLASIHGQGHSLHPGLAPPAPSSAEMQLRRVLHDIRGTVQSLSQVSPLQFQSLNLLLLKL